MDNDNCLETINKLLNTYKSNDYVYNKLVNHINNQLPTILDNANKDYINREERKTKLNTNKEEFINRYLNKNKFYYFSNTELFINYDGVHYNIYNEDDIIHNILTSISQKKHLMSWKYKIKINIIKQIKDSSPLQSIPESSTIQYVINNLCPAVFKTKNEAKYFLTILGDNILKKNENIIYLINSNAKIFLRNIANQAYTYCGNSTILNNFKYKYYDHNYDNCRLLDIVDNKLNLSNDFTNKHVLDLLCVAAHYSNRYGTADDFLKKCYENEIKEHALFLKNNTLGTIVDKFINSSLEPSQNSSIDYKNMLYLWKKYLEKHRIPNITFHTTFKSILISKLKYNEESCCFVDITSLHLPLVKEFIKFWDNTIEEDNNETELEIDEIITLFKSKLGKQNYQINEIIVCDLIKTFYPDIIIENEKYVINITCNLWNKKDDIIESLNDYKNNNNLTDNNFIHIDNLYEYYCNFSKRKICIVSKKYFEKFVTEYMSKHIDNHSFIQNSWWN